MIYFRYSKYYIDIRCNRTFLLCAIIVLFSVKEMKITFPVKKIAEDSYLN